MRELGAAVFFVGRALLVRVTVGKCKVAVVDEMNTDLDELRNRRAHRRDQEED